MDIEMPIMDGVEALGHIRSGESSVLNRAVPVIALTAFAMQGDEQKFLDAGMDFYLAKPIKSSELRFVLNKFYMIS